MLIDEAVFPIEFEWEGELAPPSGVFAKGDGLPRVSLGRPAWWSDTKVLGEKWMPPASGQRYGLVRFVFSVRPEERQAFARPSSSSICTPGARGRARCSSTCCPQP